MIAIMRLRDSAAAEPMPTTFVLRRRVPLGALPTCAVSRRTRRLAHLCLYQRRSGIAWLPSGAALPLLGTERKRRQQAGTHINIISQHQRSGEKKKTLVRVGCVIASPATACSPPPPASNSDANGMLSLCATLYLRRSASMWLLPRYNRVVDGGHSCWRLPDAYMYAYGRGQRSPSPLYHPRYLRALGIRRRFCCAGT
jgi:hypothetical protein